jgi:hypothetical protein
MNNDGRREIVEEGLTYSAAVKLSQQWVTKYQIYLEVESK